MREIKFRGKNKYGDWEYGSLSRDEPQDRYYVMNNETGFGREVAKDTIGQFTRIICQGWHRNL